jgi:hypothetical protein|eukprot:COSAG02_NODE_495_length_21151_cov_31.954256_17_plen_91_part_00
MCDTDTHCNEPSHRPDERIARLWCVQGDGLPIVPMSDVHKYIFDTKGWLLLPGLLSEEELVPIREHQLKNRYHPEELPPEQRDYHGVRCT